MSASELSAGIRPGEILAGKYRVERLLGAGGMGVVVCAHHLQLDQRVAMKFLLPSIRRDEEALARFDREARAAARIKSEHVARVLDVGHLDTGVPFIVMEYLDGLDLSAWQKQHGPMPVEQAVGFVLQACEAIAEAHALGIVHRDLKPSNLFCLRQADGQLFIKVLDFGISKMLGLGPSESDLEMTGTEAMLGSPLYIAPEQMQSSRSVDARADIWSLGVILYKLITQHVPFEADGIIDLVLLIARSDPPSLKLHRPDAPAGLDAVIARCLQKDRDLRYGNVAELADALLEFGPPDAGASVEKIARVIQGSGVATPPRRAPAAALESAPRAALVGLLTAWGKTAGISRSRAIALVGAVGAVGVLLGASAVVLATRAPPAPAPAESSLAPPSPSDGPGDASDDRSPDTIPTATISGRHVTPPRPRPAVNCNPPYNVDSRGIRIFRKECL